MRKRTSSTPVDWIAVEQLRRRSFHGQLLSEDELALCKQAIREDVERYHRIGVQVREDYQKSLNTLR